MKSTADLKNLFNPRSVAVIGASNNPDETGVDTVKSTANLKYLFNPRSVAIIGASDNPDKVGGQAVEVLINSHYKGATYFINQRLSEIEGQVTYKSITEIEEVPDLAMICVPVNGVLKVVQDCIDKGVKAIITFTSGFSETSEEGKEIQEKLRTIIESSGVIHLGPNCLGLVNMSSDGGAFSTLPQMTEFPKGNVGVVTNSGGIGLYAGSVIEKMGLGYSHWVAPGNQVGVQLVDVMNYFVESDDCEVIASYVEGISDGREFIQMARKAAKAGKPIVLYKVGKTEEGAQAILSHTASLTGTEQVWDMVLRENGVIRADNLQNFADTVYLSSFNKFPKRKKVGVVAASGGAAVIQADELAYEKMILPEFSVETVEKLKEVVPSFGSVNNPVDTTVMFRYDYSIFTRSIRAVAEDVNCDSVLVSCAPLSLPCMLDEIADIVNASNKLIVFVTVGAPVELYNDFRAKGVPIFEDYSRAIRALSQLCEYGIYLNSFKEECDEQYVNVPVKSRNVLSEYESKQVLRGLGIPVTREILALSAEEAVKSSQILGYPVVMKVISPDIIHKTEIGGVALNVKNDEEVRNCYSEMMKKVSELSGKADIQGILVQEMVSKGVEVIIGIKRDPVFGPVLTFGLGGIFTELFKDVTYKLAPTTPNSARKMLEEIKGYPLLNGFRGGVKADIAALVDLLVRVSNLSEDLAIEQLDLNPVVVLSEGQGLRVLDATIILK